MGSQQTTQCMKCLRVSLHMLGSICACEWYEASGCNVGRRHADSFSYLLDMLINIFQFSGDLHWYHAMSPKAPKCLSLHALRCWISRVEQLLLLVFFMACQSQSVSEMFGCHGPQFAPCWQPSSNSRVCRIQTKLNFILQNL
jgi:hypothetical protein